MSTAAAAALIIFAAVVIALAVFIVVAAWRFTAFAEKGQQQGQVRVQGEGEDQSQSRGRGSGGGRSHSRKSRSPAPAPAPVTVRCFNTTFELDKLVFDEAVTCYQKADCRRARVHLGLRCGMLVGRSYNVLQRWSTTKSECCGTCWGYLERGLDPDFCPYEAARH
jgi:hypothetical protein